MQIATILHFLALIKLVIAKFTDRIITTHSINKHQDFWILNAMLGNWNSLGYFESFFLDDLALNRNFYTFKDPV